MCQCRKLAFLADKKYYSFCVLSSLIPLSKDNSRSLNEIYSMSLIIAGFLWWFHCMLFIVLCFELIDKSLVKLTETCFLATVGCVYTLTEDVVCPYIDMTQWAPGSVPFDRNASYPCIAVRAPIKWLLSTHVQIRNAFIQFHRIIQFPPRTSPSQKCRIWWHPYVNVVMLKLVVNGHIVLVLMWLSHSYNFSG